MNAIFKRDILNKSQLNINTIDRYDGSEAG